MPANQLRDFQQLAAYLDKRGELRRVRVQVDPACELAEVVRRAARLPDGGPALLFEQVKGSSLPVLANTTGSPQRLAWSLSLNHLSELAELMRNWLKPAGPQDLAERLARLGETSNLARYAPRSVKSGPCQEVVQQGKDVLDELPAILHTLQESGPVLRSVLLFSRNSQGRDFLHRGHLVRTAEGAFITGLRLTHGEERPAAVVIGADPTLTFAASAPLLPPLDLLVLAGLIGRSRLEMVRCKIHAVEVPAQAQIVVEGYIEAAGDDLRLRIIQPDGVLATTGQAVRFKPAALTRRKDALLVTTVAGNPPHEELMALKGVEQMLLPLLKQAAPEIQAILVPWQGSGNHLLVVAINKTYPGQAQQIMFNLWGAAYLRQVRHILVLDVGPGPLDLSTAVARALSLIDPAHDIQIVHGPVVSSGHPDTPLSGSKIGLDATRKLPGEPGDRYEFVEAGAAVEQLVNRRWLDYGFE